MSKAQQYFRQTAQSAFSLRKALSVPILSKLAEPFCDFKYKSKGINDALKGTFGTDYLFGQKRDASDRSGDQVKVGVISCQEGGNQRCLLANYSRNPPERLKDGREGCKLFFILVALVLTNLADDCLQRQDQQSKDFLTWQA